ncbi:MAG: glycine betaine ABC transporter substrate-binding protein, partial [Burkholderiales bacterium]
MGSRSWSFLAVLLLASALSGGCSAGRDDRIVIGSKNFTEQIILGELVAQHLEARTGLRVERRLDLGGTFICHQALRVGQIDLYVEYTGTALTALLREQPARAPDEVYRRVQQAYAPLGLEWMPPLGFNNTFALVVRGEDARRLKLKTISDIAAHTPRWRAGFG